MDTGEDTVMDAVEPSTSDNTLCTQNSEEVKTPETPSKRVPSAASLDNTGLKIDILLKATANAPIMSKKKWSVEKVKKVGWIIEFIHKFLKCEPSETIFLYVNQAFAPAPDVEVGSLYECFGSDGKLILHYCKTQAWG